MKLINNRYQQFFDFDEHPNNVLVIENSKEYLNVLQELYNESVGVEDSDFVLSDDGENLKISKSVLFLYDFLNLDLNSKKITNEIGRRISDILIEEDHSEDFYKINQLLVKINDELTKDFDFEINYDSELDVEKFVKISNYQLNDEANLLEKISSYIKVYCSLKKCQLVIFVGLFELLNEKELKLLIKQMAYNDLKSLFIEPTLKYNIKSLGKIVIDSDLCEI